MKTLSNSTMEPLFEDRLLGRVPQQTTRHEVCFSRDGRAVAFVISQGNRYSVMYGDRRDTYDHAWHLVVGPAGRTVACQAHAGGKHFVPVSGNRGEAFDWVGEPVASPDGDTIAHAAMHAAIGFASQESRDQYFVVINGIKGPAFDQVGPPVFVPGSTTAVYAARRANRWVVGTGEQFGRAYDRVTLVTFSRDGRRMAYYALQNTRWLLVCDGQVIDVVGDEECRPIGAAFNPRTSDMAYWKWQPSRAAIAVAGQRSGPFFDDGEAVVGIPVFSPDGEKVAYVGKRGTCVTVVAEDRESDPYEAVGAPVFSPDSRHLAFLARRASRAYVVLDGRVVDEFDVRWPEEEEYATYLEDVPVFSPDSQRMAYVAREGDLEFVVVDGRRSEGFSRVTGGPVFSHDGRTMACAGVSIRGKCFVLANENRTEDFDGVWCPGPLPGSRTTCSPIISPDGTKVGFGAQKGDELWWRVLQVV